MAPKKSILQKERYFGVNEVVKIFNIENNIARYLVCRTEYNEDENDIDCISKNLLDKKKVGYT